MSQIEKALKTARETKALLLGSGVLSQVAELFQQQFPHKKAIIIADNNTYQVAGQFVSEFLRSGNVEQDDAFIFHDPELYAEYTYVEILTDLLKKTDAIPIAVGSGTINDLVKLSSHLTGRQYLCVATAASMDGYTAFGASITADGAKQTFTCPAPQACLADIDILSNAPAEMTAAGYADLFAKIPGGADWILADALGIEPINKQAWGIIQDEIHETLSCPQGIKEGDPKAIEKLIEGLMLGGFAMQCSQTSRPGSGAEHMFSHLWNMEHHLHNGNHISHGFQVSIGTLSIIAMYEQALKTPLERLDIQKACDAWPTIEELDKKAIALFKDTDFPDIGLRETRAKYVDRSQLKKELTLLTELWPDLKIKLERQLFSYAQSKEYLKIVGAPVDPEEISISKERLRDTFVRSQYIRRRYTILDLAVRTHLMNPWLDGIFREEMI